MQYLLINFTVISSIYMHLNPSNNLFYTYFQPTLHTFYHTPIPRPYCIHLLLMKIYYN